MTTLPDRTATALIIIDAQTGVLASCVDRDGVGAGGGDEHAHGSDGDVDVSLGQAVRTQDLRDR